MSVLPAKRVRVCKYKNDLPAFGSKKRYDTSLALNNR